jgi:hypothetical protein
MSWHIQGERLPSVLLTIGHSYPASSANYKVNCYYFIDIQEGLNKVVPFSFILIYVTSFNIQSVRGHTVKKGKVVDINMKKEFITVEIEDDDFSVIKLLGGHDVKINDIISGNLEFLGNGKLYNETQKERMSVYIQGISCTKINAKNLME